MSTVSLVTGGNRGIGREVCRQLAAACPGRVATDMGGPGERPVTDGPASVVWAATLPDSGPTGGFFRDGHPLPW